jgi:hypothetical protein
MMKVILLMFKYKVTNDVLFVLEAIGYLLTLVKDDFYLPIIRSKIEERLKKDGYIRK